MLGPWTDARQLRQHPSNPVAALCQVDNDQAGERQPHIGMNGVSHVEELQGPERRCEEGDEAKMHQPARPGTPHRAAIGPVVLTQRVGSR